MWMKRICLLPILFIFLALIASPVDASITVTATYPSSVTQGDVTIIASFVAGEGDSGTFYLTCDQTVSGEVDPEDGYNIMSSTSKTYTFTPNTAQTYSNCKVTDGGSQYSSSFAINVVAPSTLTVTGSPSSTTNSSGDTFTLSISVTNPTSSAITTSYVLSCTPHSCSGDQTSDTISISAGATTNLQWTVTVGSSSGTISFQLGSNSNAFSSAVTLPTTETTVGNGGGGEETTGDGAAAGGETTTTLTATTALATTTISPGETTIPAAKTTTPPEIPIEVAGIPTWIIGLVIIVVVVIVAVVMRYKPRKKTLPSLTQL